MVRGPTNCLFHSFYSLFHSRAHSLCFLLFCITATNVHISLPCCSVHSPTHSLAHSLTRLLTERRLKDFTISGTWYNSDMSGFTRLTKKHGILHFLGMIMKMRSICRCLPLALICTSLVLPRC